MISILVPVYNTEVVPLTNELSKQLSNLDIEGEILVFDDCSYSAYRELNRPIINLNNVVYKELDKNHGRTAIRQLLASNAQNEWLLFLDSDSRILHPDFLQRYISAFKNGFNIYAGGRVYPFRPAECDKRLHWKYGVKRESVKGNKTAFHTNNFCIRKEIFQQLNFPDFLKHYGHEDTWMGIELERSGERIVYIDDPVEHVHIENTSAFLAKTEEALQNLLLLAVRTDRELMRKHVSLFRVYSDVKEFRLAFAINFFYRLFKPRIAESLNSCNPSLFFFDLYRLHHLIQLSKTINQGLLIS